MAKERVSHVLHGKKVVAHSDNDLLDAIAESEGVAAGDIVVADAANSLSTAAMSGDITISSSGATTIGSGTVDVGMLSSALIGFLLPVGRIDYTGVDYCKIG